MFCTNCKQTRVENETPCPHCGAPSPLLQISGIGQWGTSNSIGAWSGSGFGSSNHLQTNSWGGTVTYSPQATAAQWEQASTDQPIQQQSPSIQPQWGAPVSSFDKGTTASSSLNASWPQMSPSASSQSMPGWQENGAGTQALLPAIYQDPQMNDMRQSTVALQLVPDNAIEHLLPAIPAMPESVYVPPLYTKPRPLIPRYRIISGTLSVLIVALLLCGGAGYYVQASGMLGKVVRQFTGAPPPPVKAQTAQKLPDPPDKIDPGPASSTIPSVTTTLHLNNNNLALETDKVFTVNQTFYVTYTVNPPEGQEGKVSMKWYMNGQFFLPVTSDKVIKGGEIWNGWSPMQYAQPAEGSVEIYWNDQLGERIYFVVQPAN
jgi:hypothetical protein